MMRFALGSASLAKREAFIESLRNTFRHTNGFAGCFSVSSGVNEQPVGVNETFRGARNRAAATKLLVAEDVFCIGVESGLLQGNDGMSDFHIDIACVVILCPNGKVVRTTSMGIPISALIVAKVAEEGFNKTTVGRVMESEGMVDDHGDPHSGLTQGRFPRKDLISQALEAAFHLLAVPS